MVVGPFEIHPECIQARRQTHRLIFEGWKPKSRDPVEDNNCQQEQDYRDSSKKREERDSRTRRVVYENGIGRYALRD